jgi:hypothetical protein
MQEIEILPDVNGVPQVHLHGEAQKLAVEKGASKVLISLSHSEVSENDSACERTLTSFGRPSPSHLPRHPRLDTFRSLSSMVRLRPLFLTAHCFRSTLFMYIICTQ